METSGNGAAEKQTVWNALDGFHIELPSWGFANTGTRFGKFVQASAATTIEEKFADAGQVHALTGTSPTVALHVLWDLPKGVGDVPEIKRLEAKYGVRAGSINPKLTKLQDSCDLVEAEGCFRESFWQDVRPLVRAWRETRGLPANPLAELRRSGYVERAAKERAAKNATAVGSYA